MEKMFLRMLARFIQRVTMMSSVPYGGATSWSWQARGIPTGIIVIWSGTIASIPTGWLLCDGGSGTPNLLDRFVQSVPTAATNPGTTGGATSKTTTGHTHTTVAHDHSLSMASQAGGLASQVGEVQAGAPMTVYTVSGPGTHTPASSTTDSKSPNANSNTDSIADIRPKYYEVAFIMKS